MGTIRATGIHPGLRPLVLLLAAACTSSLLGAQTIDEIARHAVAGNPGLAALRDEMAEMNAEIPGGRPLEKFEITVAPSWYQDATTGTPGGSVSVSGPVLPQLQLNASYDFDSGEGVFGVTLQPLSKGQDIASWKEAISAKGGKYAEETARVRSRAESFYISMMIALAEKEIATKRHAISETRYKGALFKFESGLLAYKSFKESIQDYQNSLQDLLKADKALIELRKNALELFGSLTVLESATSWSISDEELSRRILELETALEKARNPATAELSQLETDLRKLEREQAATFAWQPRFKLSATTESDFGSVDASIGMSFSLDQIKSDEKSKLATKIRARQQDVERKRLSLDYTVRMLHIQTETLKEGIVIFQTALKLAEGALAEAQVQFNAGYLDRDSLESIRLDVQDARMVLTRARADVLNSLREQQLYYLHLFNNGGY
jgi:outer membrane protein TolC